VQSSKTKVNAIIDGVKDSWEDYTDGAFMDAGYALDQRTALGKKSKAFGRMVGATESDIQTAYGALSKSINDVVGEVSEEAQSITRQMAKPMSLKQSMKDAMFRTGNNQALSFGDMTAVATGAVAGGPMGAPAMAGARRYLASLPGAKSLYNTGTILKGGDQALEGLGVLANPGLRSGVLKYRYTEDEQ